MNNPKVVLANYLSHLRLKTEGRETYANVEEALADFAQRTGLTEMQKRALRRDIFVKIAASVSTDTKNDLALFNNGNAPASILPGVKPGSDTAKKLEKTRKKPFYRLTDLGPESQQNRDVENNAQQKSPGSPDANSVVDTPSQTGKSEFKGLVIEAADDWESMAEPSKPQQYQYKGTKPEKGKKGPGVKGPVSKERKIVEQIRELQDQVVKRFMDPPGSYSKPKWKLDLTNADKKLKLDLQSKINELNAELLDIRYKRKLKEEVETPKNKAALNNVKFRSIIDELLNAKNDEQRKAGFQRLSPEGLQNLYDRAMGKFESNVYYKPSQGADKERGDFVKCMVCDKHGKTWINQDNPGILPFSHLETHADELLGGVDLGSTESRKYHQEIIDAYLKRYPGASLQSRAHELANFVERLAQQSITKPTFELPHVATKSEKNLNYTDNVLLDMILHQFKRFGVDPDDRTLDELAREVLQEIKTRLNEEFPGSLVRPGVEDEEEYRMGNIGSLKEKNIPFEALHRAFREEVGRVIEEYRGTFSDFGAPVRRAPRRWTSQERQQAREERFKELRVEDIEQQLAVELGHWPKPEELDKKLRDLDMIKVGISVTGGRGCWNCGNGDLVIVENKRIAINSATCPKCGVYREVLVRVRELEWEQDYVIRDTNEADPGGPKHYIIWEDADYVGNGPKAIGNSKFVHILGREEKEIRTRLVEPTPTAQPEQEAATEPISKIELGMPVASDQYGHGRVVFLENSHIWVAWENPQFQKKAKIGALRGEVVSINSRDPNRSGYYKVSNVEVDEESSTITVNLVSSAGMKATRHFDNLGELEREVPIASEVSPQELHKIEYGSRRRYRDRVLFRIGQQAGQQPMRYVEKTVNRVVKQKPSSVVSRTDLLKRKNKRGQLLKRLFKGVI